MTSYVSSPEQVQSLAVSWQRAPTSCRKKLLLIVAVMKCFRYRKKTGRRTHCWDNWGLSLSSWPWSSAASRSESLLHHFLKSLFALLGAAPSPGCDAPHQDALNGAGMESPKHHHAELVLPGDLQSFLNYSLMSVFFIALLDGISEVCVLLESAGFSDQICCQSRVLRNSWCCNQHRNGSKKKNRHMRWDETLDLITIKWSLEEDIRAYCWVEFLLYKSQIWWIHPGLTSLTLSAIITYYRRSSRNNSPVQIEYKMEKKLSGLHHSFDVTGSYEMNI